MWLGPHHGEATIGDFANKMAGIFQTDALNGEYGISPVFDYGFR